MRRQILRISMVDKNPFKVCVTGSIPGRNQNAVLVFFEFIFIRYKAVVTKLVTSDFLAQ